ncbi:hypothetical protein MTR_5g016180 [Medicago truncatula]|uniref:Uncharacterized protein n=1 Tax=Medicago truncatula TaxID=3880 RepID=G7K3X4_MEDTR|nr:hypothetical protein MTR_5g016180 [Medicago truncatula]
MSRTPAIRIYDVAEKDRGEVPRRFPCSGMFEKKKNRCFNASVLNACEDYVVLL